jgi:pimeloyl-ACP methyl ester carboxylesterase
VKARCGWFERPENPEDATSRPIALRVAVVSAESPKSKPDAFTVINGGPGGSSIDLYADMPGAFARIHQERDIVLVDQRGTGASNPLDCPALEAASLDEHPEQVANAARDCLDGLTADTRFYTTSVAVRDLEALRQALGYPTLNVYGVSYGTRVAQHYARRYPSSVRTLVIDGIVPPDVPLGPNAALNAQRTLDRLFQRCAADARCTARFPDPSGQMQTLAARLKAGPIPLEVAHPVSGRPEHIELGYPFLPLTVRMLSYAAETASLLPLIIDEAEARQNYVPLAANALRVETELRRGLRIGMHNAVVCTEDIPFLGEVDQAALAATYMGAGQLASLEAICSVWPEGIMDGDLREPLTTDVPTLILSGEEDPITPPAYGDRVHQALPNSLHLVAKGQGHGVAPRGCLPRLIADFVERADLKTLDATCVARFDEAPFFLNLMGPVPLSSQPGQAP